MNPNRFLIFTCLWIFSAAMAQGQSPNPHTLLWRISGKGMQQPSYLYGTLHLNDKRLFSFDDSVYHAIETTGGLAIEINPDEMGAYFVNQLFDRMASGKKLKDLLDEKYFDKNRKALAKKFNKPADEIGAADVVKEKNKWMSEYMQKGEMPTFMDAYLYNLARRQGKWVGGVEDMGDQAGLMNDLVDQSDVDNLLAAGGAERDADSHRGIENMIKLYTNRDADGLYEYVEGNWTTAQKDRVLIRRNMKMARRIDSLTSIRTMFIAIGVAHLSGDSGVIKLLRQRGFTLTPVLSDKRIAASDYTFREVHLPWVPVTDELKSYSAEMPANPATVKLFGLVEMKFLMDLFNMSGFCTMAVVNPSHAANKDSLFNQMAKRMLKSEKVKPSRILEKNGLAGREFVKKGVDGNLRAQIFISDRMVYLALISSLKQDVLNSADADKFFDSFTINPYQEETAQATRIFTDSIMGVGFETPAEMSYNEKLSNKKDDAWMVTCFTGVDPSTGSYFMLFSKEVKAGYRIPSDSVLHSELYKGLQTQYSNLDRKDSMVGDSRLVRLTGINIENPALVIDVISVVRNGRHILMMMVGDSSTRHNAGIKRGMSSFHFIAHPSIPWQKNYSPDGSLSSWTPAPFMPFISKVENLREWVSYDTTTATSYLVIPDTLGKYSWYLSDSLFWKEEIGREAGKEQVSEVTDVMNGDMRGKDFFHKGNGAHSSGRRIRILLCGDKIYKLFVTGEKGLLYSPNVNAFFDSFRADATDCWNGVNTSKAALLLQDLGSSDSLTRHDAFLALRKAPFGKEDGRLLRDALFKAYRSPYDTTETRIINDQVATILARLGDSATVTFIRNSYGGLAKENRMFQNIALTLLAQHHTAGSYALLAALLQQGPVAERLPYQAVFALKDSLRLTAALYPSLQSWARDSVQGPAVAYITLSLLDSGYLSQKDLVEASALFVEAAKALLPGLTRTEAFSSSYISSLVQLIGRCHTPSSYALLRSYLVVRNNYLLQEVVLQLLKGGQAVPAAVLNRLAADPLTRTDLYRNLKKYQKAARFPSLYRTQSQFAASAIYLSVDGEDEGGIVEKLTLVSKKTAKYRGRNYTWYLYKVTIKYDEETRSYLGIAGGYDLTGVGLEPVKDKDISGIYWKEEYDGAQVQAFFGRYLKSMEYDD